VTTHSRDDRDYKVRKLSGSTDGRGIPISATASPGTTVHTALSSPAANEWDAITLYAINHTGSAISLIIEFGGTDTADQIGVTLPPNSPLTQIVPGLILNNGAVIRAYASSANAITVFGVVNRYEQEGV
jgi:hypothetical protein